MNCVKCATPTPYNYPCLCRACEQDAVDGYLAFKREFDTLGGMLKTAIRLGESIGENVDELKAMEE